MALKQKLEQVVFRSLYDSVDPGNIPDGEIATMSNSTTVRESLESRPGWGNPLNADPTNLFPETWYGLGFGSFNGVEEWIGVAKYGASVTASVYSFDPSTGARTTIAGTLNASRWVFAQYGDRIYCGNQVDGIYTKTVGYSGSNNDSTKQLSWKKFQPEFRLGSSLQVSTERPAYPGRAFIATDVVNLAVTSQPDYHSADISGPKLRLISNYSPGRTVSSGTDVIVKFITAVDLSDVDYVYWVATGINGTPRMPPAGGTQVWHVPQLRVSNDATTVLSAGDSAGNRAFVASMPLSVKVDVTGNQSDGVLYYRADISNIANVDKNAVKRMCFRIPVQWSLGLEVEVTDLTFGGKNLWGSTEPSPKIEYAFAYFNPTSSVRLPATKATLPAQSLEGLSPNSTGSPLGAWVNLVPSTNATQNGLGYTKIQIFRRQTLVQMTGQPAPAPAGEQWALIGTVDNTGTPTFRDIQTETSIQAATTKYDLTFGDVPVTLAPTAMAVWKGHLVLAIDRKLFFSWAGLPNVYLPPPDQVYDPPDESETTQGRTLFVSDDRVDPIMGVVPQDVLYIAGQRACYCMIGDSAADATPPRRLPKSRGALGPAATAPWYGGMIVASRDGLWFYEATRAFTGALDNTYRAEELTANVRESWRALAAAGGANVVVAAYDDEIIVFGGTTYLKMTRPAIDGERRWESGTFGSSVGAAASANYWGLKAAFSGLKGAATLFRNHLLDPYTLDGTAPIAWSAQTGWSNTERRKVTGVYLYCDGTPIVQIDVDDGLRGIRTLTVQRQAGQSWIPNINIGPGFSYQVKVSGIGNGDRLLEMYLVTESEGPGYGN